MKTLLKEKMMRKVMNKIGLLVLSAVIALLIVSLVPLTPTVSAEPSTTGITFSQVDFVFTNANVPNSDWGRIEVDVAEFTANQGLNEGYLNIYTDGGWVVQNLLIDNVSGMDNITTYFNLSVQVGTNVTSLSAYLEFTADPLVTFGDGPRSNYDVDTVYYNAEGAGTLQTTVIPIPMPPVVFDPAGETYDLTKPNYEGENEQTADCQCFPMSIANSLQYLKNRYGLPVPHNHVKGLKGDNSLVGKLDSACNRGVRSRQDGDGVWFDDMLEGKFKYLSENGLADKLIHRHQGYGYGSGALPLGDFTKHGITSKDESVGGKVTFEWICEQLKKCEDVEVVIQYEDATGKITGGHAVRVFGCGKTNGVPWLRYKHDAEQSDTDTKDERGLEEPPVEVPDLDGDDSPNFGSPRIEICFALSESPIPINLTNLGPEYQEILPGETAPYTIRVTNLGSETDTILLEHENISESGSCSWTVGLSKDSVTLDPDAHEDVTLSVTADSNCNISSRIKVKVTGTSQNGLDVDETITDSVIKETHVVPEFATIAIPVAAILGLLFLFSRRRRKE